MTAVKMYCLSRYCNRFGGMKSDKSIKSIKLIEKLLRSFFRRPIFVTGFRITQHAKLIMESELPGKILQMSLV
jgi:hypothetical protein